MEDYTIYEELDRLQNSLRLTLLLIFGPLHAAFGNLGITEHVFNGGVQGCVPLLRERPLRPRTGPVQFLHCRCAVSNVIHYFKSFFSITPPVRASILLAMQHGFTYWRSSIVRTERKA